MITIVQIGLVGAKLLLSQSTQDFSPSERPKNLGVKSSHNFPYKPLMVSNMPVPSEYQRAADDFYKLLMDARDSASLTTTNQAYTMVQAVFQVFRRRLDVKDAIRFLSVLPVGARALFVADWDADDPKREFDDRAVMTKEVQALRAEHNYAPKTAIRDVTIALRRNLDQAAFDRVLATLPPGAMQFWQP